MRPSRFTSRRGEAIDVVDGSASILDQRDARLCMPGDLRSAGINGGRWHRNGGDLLQ
jgi:hypothetical protein